MPHGEPHQEILDKVLATVMIPNFPSASSIWDLSNIAIEGDGMHDIHVMLLPTFIGCPALDMIADDVQTKVADLSDGLQLQGLMALRSTLVRGPNHRLPACSCRSTVSRFQAVVPRHARRRQKAIPLMTSAIPCPYCGSTETRLDSPYGPTRCRSIHYCDDCRTPSKT